MWPWAAARALTVIPVLALLPAAATPLAPTLHTCVGSGTQLSGCSMTSPGSAREETVSLKHLHQQELESRHRQAGGNSDGEGASGAGGGSS